MSRLPVAVAVACLACLIALPAAAQDGGDRREGYYYPPVTSEELFARKLTRTQPNANRAVRVAFVVEVTKAQLEAPETPRFSVFAKGGQAEHMIIVALDDEVFRTLFRARAVLAQLTSNARGTAFFRQNGIQAIATWFDMAKILGFEDIVISDGHSWSHRIILSSGS
ncbi:MAG: hypothetical protein AAF899_06580 [Pseudomonadota bacterium]